MKEFKPLDSFSYAINYWWLILVASLVGGFVGIVFSKSHPQEYRASAKFYVTIDKNIFDTLDLPIDQYQYNEDLALGSTGYTLQKNSVVQIVSENLAQMGLDLTPLALISNHRIERKQAIWELQYFDTDPDIAVQVVNTWAKIAYKVMLEDQNAGQIVDYIIFSPPNLAVKTDGAILYNRNSLILAGSLIGFVIIILIIEIMSQIYLRK